VDLKQVISCHLSCVWFCIPFSLSLTHSLCFVRSGAFVSTNGPISRSEETDGTGRGISQNGDWSDWAGSLHLLALWRGCFADVSQAVLSMDPAECDKIFPDLYLPIVEEANRQTWWFFRKYLPLPGVMKANTCLKSVLSLFNFSSFFCSEKTLCRQEAQQICV
jgi:hypothetical protein